MAKGSLASNESAYPCTSIHIVILWRNIMYTPYSETNRVLGWNSQKYLSLTFDLSLILSESHCSDLDLSIFENSSCDV